MGDFKDNFLNLALDIEDRMSSEVYNAYLNKDIWPDNLKEESFNTVKGFLFVLIKETEEHKRKILDLKNKIYDNAKK